MSKKPKKTIKGRNGGTLTPFKKGEDPRRAKGNKGSKWKKSLLKDLMALDLTGSEQQQFNALKAKFPTFFEGTDERNFQLFMELKQISLVFNSDPKVSQTAIKEIKDRVDGKSNQKIDLGEETQDAIKQIVGMVIK